MSSSPSQLKDTLVRAGAGAGKTRGLVEKVVEIYRHFRKQGQQPRIVLTTFTRKATQELKERLILRACADQDADFLQFVTDPSFLQISTIHGLLSVFLRQVGHLAGLDAGFEIASEGDAKNQARLSLRAVLINHPEYLQWLETYGFERLLEMCEGFDEAIKQSHSVRPAERKDLDLAAELATRQWKQRFGQWAKAIQEEVDEEDWQTFASQLLQFLQNWSGHLAELENFPSKPSRRSKKQAPWKVWHDEADELIKSFKANFKRSCWDSKFWPELTENWERFFLLAQSFHQELRASQESQGRLRMSDLETKSLEILRDKPFLGAIFAESWDYWMIDEYQDTSPIQVECLQALIGNRPNIEWEILNRASTLFRGADVRVFNQAEEETRRQGGEIVELRRNYRSCPDLLLWINDFMATVSPEFQSMEPKAQATLDHSVVRLIRATDSPSEMEAIVARVGELLHAGASLEDICILGRTHRNLMEVSQKLRQFGYPTHVHAARGFSSRREVIDAHALWKFLINPHDKLNLLTLLRSPWFYVEDWQLADWCEAKPRSLWQKIADLPDVSLLRQGLDRLTKVGLARTFAEMLCQAGYLDLSLHDDPAGRKESNLWKLIVKAQELEKQSGLSALDFLSDKAEVDPLNSSEGDATSAQEPGCVNLMTIHGSKGLEFKHVILPRMGEAPRKSLTPSFSCEEGIFSFPVWNESEGEYTQGPLDFCEIDKKEKRSLRSLIAGFTWL